MIIDVPVLIAFDVNDGVSCDSRTLPRAASRRTVTLRIDTDNTDKPLQYTGHYPPRDGDASQWSTDTDGMLAGLMPWKTEKTLLARAQQYPTDYCADQNEASALEAEIERRNASKAEAR